MIAIYNSFGIYLFLRDSPRAEEIKNLPRNKIISPLEFPTRRNSGLDLERSVSLSYSSDWKPFEVNIRNLRTLKELENSRKKAPIEIFLSYQGYQNLRKTKFS